MPFVKQQKTKAYFKRYQVKYRRRREGKTDYYARKRLVTQAKNKYNTPKYRLVVRFTNKDITVQVVYSKINGDYILSAAYSHELPRYGIKVGLTNWSAAYAVGLLAARRVLKKLGLDSKYEGNTNIDGSKYDVEEMEGGGPRPFKAYLDVGLRRTTTGARVFGVLKGAADGGIYIPHSENRFPGYDAEAKKLDPELLRKYIYGGHVGEYMEELQENDEEAYKKHFAKFIEEEIGPDDLEEMYQKAHEAIRADPTPEKKEREPLSAAAKEKLKQYKQAKLTLAERKERVAEKKKAFLAAQAAQE